MPVLPDVEPVRSPVIPAWPVPDQPAADPVPSSSGTPPPAGRGSAGGGRRFGAWSRLRRNGPPPGSRPRTDLRDTWQVVAGAVLVPLGVLFILMAWYGAAHTSFVQQQIPYLVSGSFAGVGCMVLGGLLYWAHWLYRLYDQADQHHDEQLAVLRQLVAALTDRPPAEGSVPPADVAAAPGSGLPPIPGTAHGPSASVGAGASASMGVGASGGAVMPARSAGADVPAASPGAADLRGGSGSGAMAAAGQRLVATASGTVAHRADCPVMAHHPDGRRLLTDEEAASLEPCRLCHPFDPPPGG